MDPVASAKSALNVGTLVKTAVAVVIVLSVIGFIRDKSAAVDGFFNKLRFPSANA